MHQYMNTNEIVHILSNMPKIVKSHKRTRSIADCVPLMSIGVIGGVTVFVRKSNSGKEEGQDDNAGNDSQRVDGQHTDVATEGCTAKASCGRDVACIIVVVSLQ